MCPVIRIFSLTLYGFNTSKLGKNTNTMLTQIILIVLSLYLTYDHKEADSHKENASFLK